MNAEGTKTEQEQRASIYPFIALVSISYELWIWKCLDYKNKRISITFSISSLNQLNVVAYTEPKFGWTKMLPSTNF